MASVIKSLSRGPSKRSSTKSVPLDVLATTYVPKLLQEIRQRGLCEEGVFRISASFHQQQELLDDMTKKELGTADLEGRGIHVICGTLKFLYRELLDPIVPSSQYDLWLSIDSMRDDAVKITKIQELLVDLQQENYDQLLAVVDLMREICANSHNNKMTSTNLAIIWGPIAFRGTNVLPGDILEDSAKSARVFQLMIDQRESVFKQSLYDTVLTRTGSAASISAAKQAAPKRVAKEQGPVPKDVVESLLTAAETGNLGTIQKQLAKYPKAISATDTSGNNMLHRAIRGQSVEVFKWVLDQSPALASCPATDRNKNTPLHDAVSEGLRGLPFVNELLSFQACIDVNLPSGTGRTALHYAARDDVPELVRALRSIDRSESSCHARDKSGKTPLHWVAGNTSMKHVKELVALLKTDVALRTRDIQGWYPLHYAARSPGGDNILPDLVCEQALAGRDRNGLTPLHLAAMSPKAFNQLKQLLQYGEQFGCLDRMIVADTNDGRTPLHSACESGQLAAVEILAEYSAAVDTLDFSGQTPLHVLVNKLCDNGGELVSTKPRWSRTLAKVISTFSLNVRDHDGRTALHYCTQSEVLSYLLGSGASANVPDYNQQTILDMAIEQSNETLKSVVLDNGGITAEDLAVRLRAQSMRRSEPPPRPSFGRSPSPIPSSAAPPGTPPRPPRRKMR